MAGLYFVRLATISWSQQIRWFPGNNRIGDDEGGYLVASCKPKADCQLALRNDAMLRDFHIPISIARNVGLEERREKSKLRKEAIGGLWFLDDQHFVHGWFHLNDRNFTCLWDQVLHGRYASCELALGVEPVRSDVWTDNPLSIVSVTVSFDGISMSGRPVESQRGFFSRLVKGSF